MNETLIGEEVVLRGHTGNRLVSLVIGAAEAFLEASGTEAADAGAFEQELRAAFAAMGSGTGAAEARLQVTSAGMEVTVRPEGDPGDGMTVLCRV